MTPVGQKQTTPVAQIFLLALFINKRFNKQISSSQAPKSGDEEAPIVEHSTEWSIGRCVHSSGHRNKPAQLDEGG
jgi:hypothetical protein